MRIKEYSIEIILTAFAITILTFSFMVNEANIQLSMNKIPQLLTESNNYDNDTDQIMLLIRYKIQKQMYENKKKISSLDDEELRAILAFKENTASTDSNHSSFNPAYYLLHFIRRAGNADTSVYNSTLLSQNNLQAAYYYERNYDFKKALGYFKILGNLSLKPEEEAIVILHTGYCYAMLGDYANAQQHYSKVINQFSESHSAITALILSQYLEEFRTEISLVLKEKDSIMKGERLFSLIAYKEAISVLEKIAVTAKPSETARIDYYKARCLEMTGKNNTALRIYFSLVNKHNEPEYAKLANRRIFIIGALKADGEFLCKAAKINNTILKDASFPAMIETEKYFNGDVPNRNKSFHNEDESKLYESLFSEFVKKTEPDVSENSVVSFNNYNKPKKKIFVRDGSIFIGKIIEDNENHLILLTIVGKVEIKKDQIIKTETIHSE